MQAPLGTQALVLYHYQSCPFCVKVRRYMERQGIELPMKDIRLDPDARRELLEKGGKTQVPALLIDGQILYESDDIIRWMEDHLVA